MSNVAISRALSLLICIFSLTFSFAQGRTITGTVTDENNNPLTGATVSVKDTRILSQTNANGRFSLNAPASAKTLTVTYVGMKLQDVSIGSQDDYVIKMSSSGSAMNEVVVIGYGTAKRANIATSISSVSEKDIKNTPVAGADQIIQGKVAGVTVSNNSGQPGGGVSVRVRGITSVNGNDPLYVVDGVAINGSSSSLSQDVLGGGTGQTGQSVLATINPNDIESIDILKDASAQAIYGSRAANGVILITTKRGKAGEGKVNYDMYYGVATVPKKLPVMNLQQYANYQNSLVPELRAAGETADTAAEFKNTALLGKGTDWQDAIFQKGITQNHQLSFSGGSGRTTYYFSGNYFQQTGTLIGTGFERYSLRMNIDHQVKSWLKAGMSANLSRSTQMIGLSDGFDAVTSVVLYNSPASPILSPDGQYAGALQVAGNPVGTDNNPVAIANLRDVRQVQSKAFGAVYAELQLAKGLTLRNEVDYDFNLGNGKAYQPLLYNVQPKATGGYDSVRIIGPSRLREQRDNSIYYSLKNYLNYNRTFGKHWVFATLGHEVQSSHWDYVQAYRENLQLNLPSLAVGAAGNNSNETIGAGQGDWRMESYFARVNYSYNNKYSLNASVRRDGSSAFGPNKRIGYFPAASVAWTITNESFASNIKGVNYLKLRAGVGAVGDQSIGSYLYATNINLGASSPFGPAGFPSNIGNLNLGWESVVTYNAGLDGTILNKKIDFSVDLYKKVTTNMLLATQLGTFSGLGTAWNDIHTPTANDGQMTNTGIDVTITSHNIASKDFTWNSTLTFSHYKNILDRLNTADAKLYGNVRVDYSGADPVVTVSQAGHPVGSFYGYVTNGLFRTPADLANGISWGLPVGVTGVWLGDQRYKDLNGDKALTDADVTFIGDPNPKFTAGFNNTFTYKGFDLNIFLYGSYGAKIFNATRMFTERLSNQWANQLTTVMDRYTPDNTNTDMPRFNKWNNFNLRVSDRYIEDGSFLRIQTLAIGYNLPKQLVNKAKIASARVYVSAQNLYTFTKYSGYDPDLGAFNNNVLLMNVDQGHYPNPRTITVGANIEF